MAIIRGLIQPRANHCAWEVQTAGCTPNGSDPIPYRSEPYVCRPKPRVGKLGATRVLSKSGSGTLAHLAYTLIHVIEPYALRPE